MPDTTNPQRYRQRPLETEAIQWTGHNADALRAFAGIDFATIDPADRTEDLDCDAQLLVEASHWVGIQPTDWVLRFEGYFIAKSDVPFRAVWEPAAETQPVTVEALARLLNGADVHIHNGHHPGWDSLAESGEEQYLGMARWLLKRLHVTEPADAPSRVAGEAPQPETQAERRETVLHFLQTQQPDGSWVDSSSVIDDPEYALVRLAQRQERVPHAAHRIARHTTTVVVEPIDPAVVSQPGKEG
ncbi:hypothetical protein [Streptomyces mirabilis]|uniref:hypothetical protein n=1 Tax=Streptomyces mirabilis TaxID=68239 RepID=UPI00167D2B9B|nr:hypothetical protein [Streptomyces mirabilis]